MADRGLTKAGIEALLKPSSMARTVADTACRGLYFQVRQASVGGRTAGAKRGSWLLRYKKAGVSHLMGLGPYPLVPLAEAREKAREARRRLLDGVDPIDHKRAAKAESAAQTGLTFAEVAEGYIRAHEASWRNPVHRAQWRSTLETYAFPVIGALPVALVDTGHVTAILEPIWNPKRETASRLRGRLEAILDYARVRGWRTGENPARWRGHLDHVLASRKRTATAHHAALPWAEVGAFVATVAAQPGVAALALRFAILTAARTGEVVGATWGEVDLHRRLWTVPASRMKAGTVHRVPLSDAAVEVLREVSAMRLIDDPSAPVFVGGGGKGRGGLSNMAMLALLRRIGRADLTVHGFRSTFRDWTAEATSHPREVAEAALAHAISSKVEAAYARSDLLERRRTLMNEWARFATEARDADAVVVPLRLETA